MAEASPYVGVPANAPESVKARIMAARLLAEGAAQQERPYTSGAVVGLKAISGLMGGLQERQAIQEAQQGQASQRAMMASYLMNSASPGALGPAGAAAPTAAPTSGMIPGSAPTGPANALPSGGAGASDYFGRLGHIESGNSDAASNKASGATGRYQFIASTWNNLSRQYPELGLTSDGRTDPAQQQRAIQAFTNDNISALGRSGFQATPGNLYLAHFAGAGGATAALKADPNTPVEQVLGSAAVNANPFLRGKTAGDLVGWANGKMAGVDPSTLPGAPPAARTTVASAAPFSPANTIGDAAALAAQNRIGSGAGTDADRALLVSYRQQQNAPSPQRTASADVPAPNAQPVASSSLPPGVTPDMLGPGASAPSPFGALPQSMAQAPATPDAATLAAALRGSANGPGPSTTPLPTTVQPSSPFGVMPPSMDQESAAVPGPTMASAPPPSPMSSPFGGPPQPMAPQGSADPKLVAQLLAKGSSPTPITASPAPDPSLMAGAPTAPQAAPLSANALAMGDLGPGGPGPGALDPSAGALPAAGLSTAQLPGFDNFGGDGSVRQTSLVSPGDPNSTPGFTGSFGPGIQPQISGALPSPDMLAQGTADMGSPASPSPAVMAAALRQGAATPATAPTPDPTSVPTSPTVPAPTATQTASLLPGAVDDFGRPNDPSDVAGNATAAMAKAGMDVTGLPGAPLKATTPPLPTMAGANVPPPDLSGLAGSATPPTGSGLPIMARASSNPLAALQQDFAGLGQSQAQPQPIAAYSTEPSSRPGAQAARNRAVGVPMPPPRPSDTALGLDPDAPVPGATPAGPASVPPQLMASLLAQGAQPNAVPGNSPTADPSSPQNFMRQEAQRAAGGGYSNPTARALAGQTTAPAASQDDGNPLSAIGRLFGQSGGLGGILGNLPIIGGILGGGQQPGTGPNGQAAGSSGFGGQGQGQSFTPGGQGTPTGQQAPDGQSGSAPVAGLGGMSQQQAIALLSNPYTTPQQAELIMSRLAPQPIPIEAGKSLVGRRRDGTYGTLYTAPTKPDWQDLGNGMMVDKNDPTGRAMPIPGGRAPVKMSPGDVLQGPGGPIASVPATPDFKPVPGTATALNSRDGSSIALPGGAGATVHMLKVNGVDVPMLVTPDANGGPPQVRMLTPGAAGGQPGTAGGPISFNGAPGTDGAAPAAPGPLDGIAPLVRQAGQMKADEAAQVKDAGAQVEEQTKIAQAGRDARQKLAQLDQLEQLSGKFGNNLGTKLAAKFNEYGIPTQSGTDQEAFKGMVGALAVGERPAGSGSLRVAEMDAFKSNLGDLSTNQAGRIAAINRYRTILQRDAQMGDLASDPTISPLDRAVRLRALSQTPYAPVGGVDGSGTAASQGGGYAPNSVQVPDAPPRNVAPGVTGSPSQGQAPAPADAISQAQAAIARGASRSAVIQRLQAAGINPAGL